MKQTLRLLTLAAALAASAQSAAEIRPINGIAAEVNSSIITYGDIQRSINRLKAAPGSKDIPEAQLAQAARAALMERTLLSDAAKAQGMTVSEAQIDAELARRAAEQNTAVDALYQAAAAHGYSRQAFRVETAKDLLIDRQFADINDSVRVTDAQISAVAAQLQAAGQPLPQGVPYTVYTVRRLLLNAGSQANMNAVGKRIGQIAEAVKKGSDFTAIARRYSQEPQAGSGGLHRDISLHALPQNVAAMVEKMQPGQITIPVASGTTWQMVQLVESRTETDPDKIRREALRLAVIQAEQQKAQQQFIGQLQQSAVVREY